jgi:hypothetical protein
MRRIANIDAMKEAIAIYSEEYGQWSADMVLYDPEQRKRWLRLLDDVRSTHGLGDDSKNARAVRGGTFYPPYRTGAAYEKERS